MKMLKPLLKIILTFSILTSGPLFAQTNFEPTLKETYEDLKETDPTKDVVLLLGEEGALTAALDMASLEMAQADPDVETCSKIMELSQVIIAKLEEAKADVKSVAEKLTLLYGKIETYNKPVVADKVDIGTSLDEILKKGKLTSEVLETLFGKENSLASLILQKYKDVPKDPVNKIRALIVEKIRRRFEAKFNSTGTDISKEFYSAIKENDFLKDRKTIGAWEAFLDEIRYEDLMSTKSETRKELRKYEAAMESIGDLKFGAK
jgi:hypothetical protein